MSSLTKTSNNESLQIAFESIDSCFGYIDHITAKIQFLIGLYNTGELNLANEALIEVVDLMDLYIQLISKVYNVIRLNLNGQSFKDEGIQKLEIHLLSIIKALLSAKEKEDIIMLCDLLEYELIDNLTQWKIKALPELRKLKNF
jgi:hypothetical protein